MRRIAAITAAASMATAALGQAPAIERAPLGTPARSAGRGEAAYPRSVVRAARRGAIPSAEPGVSA